MTVRASVLLDVCERLAPTKYRDLSQIGSARHRIDCVRREHVMYFARRMRFV